MEAIAIVMLTMLSVTSVGSALSVDYYELTCPQVEYIVAGAGCDASVLLESKGKKKAEKDGPANTSSHAFYVIYNANKAQEAVCPGVVSCADTVALTAGDAVFLSGGHMWEVPKGRKDRRISADETRQLPASVFKIYKLEQIFSQRGLSLEDLVALSGGHTLGFAHCSSFQNRIHNFSPKQDIDPSMNPSFAARLRRFCPYHNKVKNAGSPLDSSSATFDKAYYRLLLQGKSIFTSDQALLTRPKTKALVSNKEVNRQKYLRELFVFSHLLLYMVWRYREHI